MLDTPRLDPRAYAFLKLKRDLVRNAGVDILSGGLVGHVGTSFLLDSLALSLGQESQCRTTGGDGVVPAGEAQADEKQQRA
jgi:hypothetical protein